MRGGNKYLCSENRENHKKNKNYTIPLDTMLEKHNNQKNIVSISFNNTKGKYL